MKNPMLRRIRIAVAGVFFSATMLAFLDFRHLVREAWTSGFVNCQFLPSLLRGFAGIGAGAALLWVLISLLAGRVYCSTVCPLGILQDVIWSVRRMAVPRHLKSSRAANGLRYGVFLGAVAAGICGMWVVVSLLDPYSIFGRIASSVFRPLVLEMNNLFVPLAEGVGVHALYRMPPPPWGIPMVVSWVIVIGLVILVAWRGRIFCNAVCPVGTFLGVLSRHAVFQLQIDKTHCEKCGDCLRSCKAQCIDLKAQEIDFSRCVACYDCVTACDKGGISYRRVSRHLPENRGRETSRVAGATDPGLRRTLRALAVALLPAILAPRALGKEDRGNREHKGHDHRRHGPGSRAAIIPPGAVSLERFLDLCTACGLCVANCPTQTLQPAFLEYGLRGIFKPVISPEIGYCQFECTRCMEICPTGALRHLPLVQKKLTQLGEAHFHEKHCIVYTDGTDCAACSEHCPTKAVDTVPFRGNLLLPQVNEALCIGCGACEFACPVRPERAIRVSGKSVQTTATPPVPSPIFKPVPRADFPF